MDLLHLKSFKRLQNNIAPINKFGMITNAVAWFPTLGFYAEAGFTAHTTKYFVQHTYPFNVL
ncbi:Uncharacterised protein [Neisseria animaloris]|nr:hypothetical protein BWD08_02710 [Neisseria animaloris]VEH86476.1 Uncharacterised protein [Neisseria animaloris]